MFRFFSYAIGAVFVGVLLIAAFAAREATEVDPTQAFHKYPKHDVKWSWQGPTGLGIFGGFDRTQLQRGFQVYKDVCAACHSLNRIAFRNLQEIGFSEPEVKAIAKNWVIEVPTVNPDTGEAATRPAIPSDYIPLVYPNEIAARAANNNALPPDLSLITKARADGTNYVYSLLTGYEELPADYPEESKPGDGLYYNPYFHSMAIAMAPPLAEGIVEYAEGQPAASVDQMGQDVSAFLAWAAEPKLEERKRIGLGVMIFLLIFTVLAYLSYRRVWADLKQ